MKKEKIIGYHYTNPIAYKDMETGRMYHKKGLIPIKRFVRLFEGRSLPNEAHEGVIEGLLEPEPKSWTNNSEFPYLWGYLMGDVCKRDNVLLLSFNILPKDKAYVVDRAHMERELYRESKGFGKITKESMDEAYEKYWNSRIPVFDYKGGYSLPQLTIWSPIEFERLNIEWINSSDKIWKKFK